MTPTPDPETLTVLRSSGGWATGLATLAATLWGVILFRKTRAEKEAERDRLEAEQLQKKLDAKADKQETDDRVRMLRDEIEKRKGIEAKLFDQMREDRDDVLKAITSLTSSIATLSTQTLQFQATVATELGKRPTREELRA